MPAAAEIFFCSRKPAGKLSLDCWLGKKAQEKALRRLLSPPSFWESQGGGGLSLFIVEGWYSLLSDCLILKPLQL